MLRAARHRRSGQSARLHRNPIRCEILVPSPPGRGADRGHAQGADVRYVVTNLAKGGAQWLYDIAYCTRGQAENLIKRHKTQLASDRTSCRLPLANQMRLILHTAAYWLMRTIRDTIPKQQVLGHAEFSTIRLRLLKVAVRIRETASRIRLAFAANCPDAELLRDLI
jgi:hypothetical protein